MSPSDERAAFFVRKNAARGNRAVRYRASARDTIADRKAAAVKPQPRLRVRADRFPRCGSGHSRPQLVTVASFECDMSLPDRLHSRAATLESQSASSQAAARLSDKRAADGGLAGPVAAAAAARARRTRRQRENIAKDPRSGVTHAGRLRIEPTPISDRRRASQREAHSRRAAGAH